MQFYFIDKPYKDISIKYAYFIDLSIEYGSVIVINDKETSLVDYCDGIFNYIDTH